MTANAKMMTSAQKGHSFPVQIIEEGIKTARGIYSRAITVTGNKLVAPSKLFIKLDNKQAMAQLEEITTDAAMAKLRNKWAS